jgi:hypothetical protein
VEAHARLKHGVRPMRIRVDTNAPSIQRQARRYEKKLVRALALAVKRTARRAPLLVRHFHEAQVEGVNPRMRTKTAAITFTGQPFRGSLIQIYDWKSLDEFSVSELTDGIIWSLNHSLRHDPSWNKRV